jgi:hypothetical protein
MQMMSIATSPSPLPTEPKYESWHRLVAILRPLTTVTNVPGLHWRKPHLGVAIDCIQGPQVQVQRVPLKNPGTAGDCMLISCLAQLGQGEYLRQKLPPLLM